MLLTKVSEQDANICSLLQDSSFESSLSDNDELVRIQTLQLVRNIADFYPVKVAQHTVCLIEEGLQLHI